MLMVAYRKNKQQTNQHVVPGGKEAINKAAHSVSHILSCIIKCPH